MVVALLAICVRYIDTFGLIAAQKPQLKTADGSVAELKMVSSVFVYRRLQIFWFQAFKAGRAKARLQTTEGSPGLPTTSSVQMTLPVTITTWDMTKTGSAGRTSQQASIILTLSTYRRKKPDFKMSKDSPFRIRRSLWIYFQDRDWKKNFLIL